MGWQESEVTQAWHQDCRTEAGITKTVSPHILRHSAAVHMAEKGRSMEELQRFLGHSDINVTRKIYARFSPSYLKEAAEAYISRRQRDKADLPRLRKGSAYH